MWVMRPSEALKLNGKPIAYFPQLAKPLGGANASILFSHFFYWNDKGESELGIYRTAQEIEQETGLTVQEQRTARAKLRERGILIETEKRIEHRIYYRLDLDVFDELMMQHSRNAESTFPESQINSPEMQNQHSGSGKSTAVIGTEDLAVDLAGDISFVVGGDTGSLKTAADQTPEPAADIADESALVGADAPTRKPKSGLAEDKKRFEAVAKVFNRVFENCPAVAKVSLATVPDPKTGRPQYTQTNLKRLKLMPYAWTLARQRVEGWADENGLIDGEAPNAKHVLQWFEAYFAQCLADGFINGSQPRSESHANWRAGFDFLLRPLEMEKRVFEGGR